MAPDETVKAFAALLSAEQDPQARQALLKRASMLAMNQADLKAFEPPITSLGDYLDTPIEIPPSLVWPTLCVRGEITTTLGRAGRGKLLPMDERVLTPDGWVRNGDLCVGDEVSNPVTGRSSKIVGVFPQGEQDIYCVTLTDGSKLEVGLEHLWEVLDRAGGHSKIMSTADLLAVGVRAGTDKKRYRWALPAIEPIEFRREQLPIPPWAFGALLGDGCLGQQMLSFSTADPCMLERLFSELPAEITIGNKSEVSYDFRICDPHGTLKGQLSDMGLRVNSGEKFIPDIYKFGSVADRIEVLRGLMDTDGDGRGGEFCSKSKKLVEDVIDIVRSLGGRAKLQHKTTAWTHLGVRHTGEAWRAKVKLPKGICPFWLQRKIDVWNNSTFQPTRLIDTIEFVGRKDAQCIAVDHHRHLYVAGDFVVSHNTTMNLNRILKWAAGRPMFDGFSDSEGRHYLAPDQPLRVLIIENEGAAGMFHQKMGILLNNCGDTLTDADRALIRENVFVWGDGGYSGLKLDNETSLSHVRAGVEKCKPDIVFIEPFRSLWRGEENSSTEMNAVVDNLVGLATDYGCGVILSHHERKAGAGEDGELMSAGRGSTVLEGVVAVMENWQSAKGGDFRELTWSKARYLQPPIPMRVEYDRDTGWYRYVPLDSIETAIIQALEENSEEPMSVKDLTSELGEKDHKLRPLLNKLVSEGRLKKMPSVSTQFGSTGHRYRLPSGDNDHGGLAL